MAYSDMLVLAFVAGAALFIKVAITSITRTLNERAASVYRQALVDLGQAMVNMNHTSGDIAKYGKTFINIAACRDIDSKFGAVHQTEPPHALPTTPDEFKVEMTKNYGPAGEYVAEGISLMVPIMLLNNVRAGRRLRKFGAPEVGHTVRWLCGIAESVKASEAEKRRATHNAEGISRMDDPREAFSRLAGYALTH